MKTRNLLGLLPFVAVGAMAQESPNIILIMTDDMGWGDVGFNGNTVIKTPNLDQLASEGMVFDRFYAGCSVSSPTRASVLTGRNPFRTGVFHANTGILRPEEVTLPELLQQRGYFTGHFGKWHLGTLTHTETDANRGRAGETSLYNLPREHGYVESFVTESKVPTYDPMKRPAECDGRFWDCLAPGDPGVKFSTFYWKHNGEKETENLEGDDSRVIMDRVLPFIQQSKAAKRPFFSVVWFHTPHLPCVAGPEYAKMYEKYSLQERNYYGCISAMDEQVGRLVSFLKEEGLYENTILCFCSDNGPELRTPGTAGTLRGKKRDLYEGGIRVPAFVVWPGQVPGDQRTDHIASTSDYLPTFVDLLNLPTPSNEIDGESLMGFFKNQDKRKKPLVFAVPNPHQGAVIEQQYKLFYKGGKYELYDIQRDPNERRNLASDYPMITERLRKVLDENLESYRQSYEGAEYGRASRERVHINWIDIVQK